MDETKIVRLMDGDVLEIDHLGAHRRGTVTVGKVLVDGDVVGVEDKGVVRDRRNISSDGMVLVVLAVAQQSGMILSGPDFVMRGVATEGGPEPDEEPLRRAVEAALAAMPKAAVRDLDELSEEVRVAARRWFRRNLGSRPLVVPYVMEL